MVKRDCGDWPGAIIVAAATERVLLQWNQFGRQTRSAPSSRVPGRGGAAFFCENRAGPTCVGAGLRRGVRAAGSYRCGWRFESSRAHHAVFLTARFLRDCQQASNWRAFAAAFGSQRRPFLASMRILGVVSLGRGISFPRCRSILDKTCACSCARRCFYVTPRCPRRPSANSIVYPSGS